MPSRSLNLQLILGGARSGKSRYALSRGDEEGLRPKWFLATATAGDSEMRQRIQRHRKERGPKWKTFEEPYRVPSALARLARRKEGLVVVDCATLWLSNLLCGIGGKPLAPSLVRGEFKALLKLLPRLQGTLRIVSNEVGLGIVPVDPLARQFQDLQGELNRSLASAASEVIFMTAGIASRIK